jgi:thioredoxin-related protein
MKKASELFPKAEFYDYECIVKEFGEILINIYDDSYQGDWRVLIKKDNKYGILIFGFGSCSGCDALQSCRTYEEVDKLIEEMYNNIFWFDDLESCKKWVRERDWELQYSWHCDETKDFIEKVLNY